MLYSQSPARSRPGLACGDGTCARNDSDLALTLLWMAHAAAVKPSATPKDQATKRKCYGSEFHVMYESCEDLVGQSSGKASYSSAQLRYLLYLGRYLSTLR